MVPWDKKAIVLATENIISAVDESCIVFPLT